MSISKEALTLMAKINKEHGEGSVVFGTDMTLAGRFPSGSLGLDVILGSGWAANQWVEVYGKESHAKSAIVLKTIATNQQLDPNFTTLWIASEHYNDEYAQMLGIDNERVIVIATQEMEFAFDTIITFLEASAVDCVVLDSYPALIPSEEAEKDMDGNVVAVGARKVGKFFRKVGAASKRPTDGSGRNFLGIIVNQLRDDIGGFSPHGTPTITPGGKAKNYFFYTRVLVKRDDWIYEARPGKGKTIVGQTIKLQTIKHKAGPAQQIATVDFYNRDAPLLNHFAGEFDTVKEMLTYALLYDVIIRRGSYYTLGDRKWGPGKDSLLASMREEVDLQEQLREAILEAAARPDRENFGKEEEDA